MSRVWVDIANSPHATFFKPVVDVLRERGHQVILTAWDRAQTEELARRYWPEVEVVGAGSDRSVVQKSLRIWKRARGLAAAVRDARPDVALGHNSYSQVIAARLLLRTRAVTMMDYEHQPANHLAFRLAHDVVVPAHFPEDAARKMGARRKLLRYDGFKEEITLAVFRPEAGFRSSLGVTDDEVLVASRPPPDGALYHRHSNDLFARAIETVAAQGATVLLSPRTVEQGRSYSTIEGVRVLEHAVSGLDLLWASDLVVGAGGTMTREAAILGTPSYTLFSGKPAAVDGALIESGRLVRVSDAAAVAAIPVVRKPRVEWTPPEHRVTDVVTLLEKTFS